MPFESMLRWLAVFLLQTAPKEIPHSVTRSLSSVSSYEKVPVITLLRCYSCIYGCKLGDPLEEGDLGVLPPEKFLLVLVTEKLVLNNII